MNKIILLLATFAAVNTCNSSLPPQAQETIVKSSPLQENINRLLATNLRRHEPDDLVKLLHQVWNCLVHESPEESNWSKTPEEEFALCQKAHAIKIEMKKNNIPLPDEPDMLKAPESLKKNKLPPCQGPNRQTTPKYKPEDRMQSF